MDYRTDQQTDVNGLGVASQTSNRIVFHAMFVNAMLLFLLPFLSSSFLLPQRDANPTLLFQGPDLWNVAAQRQVNYKQPFPAPQTSRRIDSLKTEEPENISPQTTIDQEEVKRIHRMLHPLASMSFTSKSKEKPPPPSTLPPKPLHVASKRRLSDSRPVSAFVRKEIEEIPHQGDRLLQKRAGERYESYNDPKRKSPTEQVRRYARPDPSQVVAVKSDQVQWGNPHQRRVTSIEKAMREGAKPKKATDSFQTPNQFMKEPPARPPRPAQYLWTGEDLESLMSVSANAENGQQTSFTPTSSIKSQYQYNKKKRNEPKRRAEAPAQPEERMEQRVLERPYEAAIDQYMVVSDETYPDNGYSIDTSYVRVNEEEDMNQVYY